MPFRYFDLPGEIRNQVMEHALVPGTICLPSPKSPESPKPLSLCLWGYVILCYHFLDSFISKLLYLCARIEFSTISEPLVRDTSDFDCYLERTIPGRKAEGFELLATCRRAWREGDHIYMRNRFLLPSGPVIRSEEWLNSISPCRWNMTKRVICDFTLGGRDPKIVERIYTEALRNNPAIKDPNGGEAEKFFVKKVVEHLDNIWSAKMRFAHQLNHGKCRDTLSPSKCRCRTKINNPRIRSAGRIKAIIQDLGLQEARRWLVGDTVRGIDEMHSNDADHDVPRRALWLACISGEN